MTSNEPTSPQPNQPEPDNWQARDDQRVLRLSELTRACAAFGENLREQHGAVPSDSSPARGAVDETYGQSTLLAFDLATQKMVIIEDLLRGFAMLLEPPAETPFAFQVLLRSILELSAAVWRLADCEADPKTTAGRAMTEQIENARRNAALATNVRDEESRDEADAARAEQLDLIDTLFDEAEKEGLTIVLSKKGDRLAVEEIPPSATELVAKAWDATHPRSGGFLYGFFSGVPHGRTTAFGQNLKIHEEEGGRVRGRVFMSLQQIEMWTQVALLGWSDAMERLVAFAGWNQDLWLRWQRHVAGVLGRAKIKVGSTNSQDLQVD